MSDAQSGDPTRLARSDATAAGHRLRVAGFAALWRGDQPAIAELCDDRAAVEALVRAGRLEVNDAGILVGVHGLVARPTRHRIEHRNVAVHTWCALDAIGIPAALAIDATAVTSCPTCEAELRVVLRNGEPLDAAETLRLWLPEGRCDHLVADFCNHANLYCTPAHLTATVPSGSPGRIAAIPEVAAIGSPTRADAAAALGGDGEDRLA